MLSHVVEMKAQNKINMEIHSWGLLSQSTSKRSGAILPREFSTPGQGKLLASRKRCGGSQLYCLRLAALGIRPGSIATIH